MLLSACTNLLTARTDFNGQKVWIHVVLRLLQVYTYDVEVSYLGASVLLSTKFVAF